MESECETYECRDNFDADYYENDLQLAAELGKALLEKNRELEFHVQQQQQTLQDQSFELEHVHKQLDSMRIITESRNHLYEEVDRLSLELESQSQKFFSSSKNDRQNIDRLANTIEHLECKVEEAHRKLEDAKDAERFGKHKMEKRRTASLASLNHDIDDNNGYYIGNLAWTQTKDFNKYPLNCWEAEIVKLHEMVQHFKTQLSLERHTRKDLEDDIDGLEKENNSLMQKVTGLEDRLSEAMLLEYELEETTHTPHVCFSYRKSVDVHDAICDREANLMSEVENDEPLLLSEAKVVKLDGGGSLYSSSMSINKVSSCAREVEEGRSILDELEAQYKALLAKYESLIQNKSKRLSQALQAEDSDAAEERALRRRLAHKEVQTLLHMTLGRDLSDYTQHQPPYKALFKDLFAALHVSKVDE